MPIRAVHKTTVLIIGGGPAGATAALRLLQKGITPLIVERNEFPRFHIGESMTGECGAIKYCRMTLSTSVSAAMKPDHYWQSRCVMWRKHIKV